MKQRGQNPQICPWMDIEHFRCSEVLFISFPLIMLRLWPSCLAQVGIFSCQLNVWVLFVRQNMSALQSHSRHAGYKLPYFWETPRNHAGRKMSSPFRRCPQFSCCTASLQAYDDGKYVKSYSRRSRHPPFSKLFPPAVQGTCTGVYSGCLTWLDSAFLPAGIWKSAQGNLQQHLLHRHYCHLFKNCASHWLLKTRFFTRKTYGGHMGLSSRRSLVPAS